MQIIKKTVLAAMLFFVVPLMASAHVPYQAPVSSFTDVSLSGGAFPMITAQNEGNKQLRIQDWPNAPVELVGISSSAGIITRDKPFSGKGNWLQGFSVRFKNTSDKNIVGVRYSLILPRPQEAPSPVAVWVTYGQGFDKEDTKGVNPIVPQKEGVASLDQEDYKALVEMIRLTSLGSLDRVNKAKLILQAVYFADGTYWLCGNMSSSTNNQSNSATESEEQQRPGFGANIAFCGVVVSESEVTCCKNPSRGCYNQVRKITLRTARPTELTITACPAFFPCRCDSKVLCTSDIGVICNGYILDCGDID